MSNFYAVGAVTATIAYVLRGVGDAVQGAGVHFNRPDRLRDDLTVGEAGVNIYLYKIDPDPSFRNADLPFTWTDGQPAALPQAALDLNYLVSFYGDDTRFEPQRLLGWTEAALHREAVLTPDTINAAINTSTYKPYVGEADLAQQLPQVRINPLSLSLEDMSKIWSVFFQTQYLLSVAYQASVVLVVPEESPPIPAPPVLEVDLQIHTGTLQSPAERVIVESPPTTRLTPLRREPSDE